MIEVWDYFMRRKKILLLVLMVFAAGGILSYKLLQQQTTKPESYISISDWGQDAIEVPKTGEDVNSYLAVISPEKLAELEFPENTELEDRAGDEGDYKVEKPENIVKNNSTASSTSPVKKHSVFYTILLTLTSVAILALGGYLTYQHFMR